MQISNRRQGKSIYQLLKIIAILLRKVKTLEAQVKELEQKVDLMMKVRH